MSLEGLVALLAVVAGLMVWALLRSRHSAARLAALDEALRHAEAAGREQASRVAALEALRDTQQLTEHAIATGTAVVREVHRGIADIPFSVLEAIPAARGSAKALRGLHDAISDGVYGALGNLNKAVGRELRKGVPLQDAPPAAHPAADSAADSAADPAPAPPDGGKKEWG